jgi:hypothetical protein
MKELLYGKRIKKPTKEEYDTIIECGNGTRLTIYEDNGLYYFLATEKRTVWFFNSVRSETLEAYKGSKSIEECKKQINNILGSKWSYRKKPCY